LISVVIPTLNEARTLPGLLGDLSRMVVPFEIVIVDGGSNDGTPQNLLGPKTRVLTAPRGRATQMNAGARLARGDWLLFLHADSRLPPAARRALLSAVVDDPELQAATFRFAIDLPPRAKQFIEFGQALRQKLYGLPYGDQGLLIRRDLFESVGGFPELPLLEDVALFRRLRRMTRVAELPAPIVTSGRRYQERGLIRTWLVNTAVIALYFAGVAPQRLARWRG
jgi:rSAM/selenodomain-associated transferase 2